MSSNIKSIKVISRNPDHYIRETSQDLHKVQRNYDPSLHPLAAAREFKLALNAVKLERIFAKPFIGSLGHREAVSSLCLHPTRLSCAYSGTVEGEIQRWDLQGKVCEWKCQAHSGAVHCIASIPDGSSFLTVGNDKTIKKWPVDSEGVTIDEPLSTWMCDTLVTGVSHHRYRNEFVTCGERVLLWDATSKAPKASYDWSLAEDRHEATVVCVKFSPVQPDVFASSDMANNLVIYDTRAKGLKKLKMTLRLNYLDWNPMESFILTGASEDYNCYSFDVRMMDHKNRIVGVHQGHTSAVTCLSYSPTGKEFCSGSFDKSLRIFRVDESHSRDVYHTKRMFKLTSVLWSADSKYILSGSTDHNVRLWKANASEKMGIMRHREEAALNYSKELKQRYIQHPQVKRIDRHRHLPKHVFNAKREHEIMKNSAKRKDSNRRKHSKPGSVPFTSVHSKAVVGLQDDQTELDISEVANQTKTKMKRKRLNKKSKNIENPEEVLPSSPDKETKIFKRKKNIKKNLKDIKSWDEISQKLTSKAGIKKKRNKKKSDNNIGLATVSKEEVNEASKSVTNKQVKKKKLKKST